MMPEQTPAGYVDLQVNGFAGVDFSAPGLTVDRVYQVAQELERRGTASFCPTVITSPLPLYEENLPVLAEAIANPGPGARMLGIHLEGPFISPADGARGAHAQEHVRAPDPELFDRLCRLAGSRVVLLTLAPDQPDAAALIRDAVSRGITVSLGHHLAGEDRITEACAAGAAAVTHFGNGLPNLLPRHPNPLWTQLVETRLQLMLITDSHHIPPTLIRAVFACRGPAGVIVVSDAAPVAGLPPGRYRTLGQAVELELSGRLWNPVGQHLVGSSASMRECVEHLRSLRVTDEAGLDRVSRLNPLALLGLDRP